MVGIRRVCAGGLLPFRSSFLIICVGLSLFVSAWFAPSVGGLGGASREVQVFIVDASDSPLWWVGDSSAVRAGVEAAIADAKARTKVVLAGESISNPVVVSSTTLLENLLDTPLERAVVINTHGEVVPMPSNYVGPYVWIDKPSDGERVDGENTNHKVTVEAIVNTMPGIELEGMPIVSWWGPGSGSLDMTLVDPVECRYRAVLNFEFMGSYTIYVWAKSRYGLATLSYVYIYYTLPVGPGPGGLGDRRSSTLRCPYVHVWDGADFEADNNILLECNSSVVDCFRLEKSLFEDEEGDYPLRLWESGGKCNFFDRVGLVGVDHSGDVNVGVDPYGAILTYANPYSPSSALLCGSQNVSLLVGEEDGEGCIFHGSTWLDVDFGGLNTSLGAKLILRMCSEDQSVVSVQRFGVSGWETVATVKPRAFWSTGLANLTGLLPDSVGECKLRLVFDGDCTLDFVGLDTTAEADVAVYDGELVSVEDSTGINATFGDLSRDDGVCARLEHGYTIDLKFRLPEVNGSLVRDFVFVAEGYYEEEMRVLGGGGRPESMTVDWKDWFDLIEDRCRSKGWIWANVAGYSSSICLEMFSTN